MKILLISPATPDTFWSFRHALPFVSKKSAFPPLGLLTIAAMLQREWDLRVCDMDVTALAESDIEWADYVFISAMLIHTDSARRVAALCASMGKPVVAGGPLFTSSHELFPEIPHFVLGEAEEIMPVLVADLEAGAVKPLYSASRRPELASTPIPRWDLIRLSDYLAMPVQFSRGCPFDCEFCDIIIMNGRKPRCKSPEQMIAEFEALLSAGWATTVFVVDDNFIGHKVRVKELLRALIEWRERRKVHLTLITEASVNIADDPDLLDLMGRAGFRRIFIGVETPEEDSLVECHKVQNTKRNLIDSIRKIQQAGMEVMGGFIIGFDGDKPNIFQRQYEFIQQSGIVTAMVGLLTALPGTKLFHRLEKEGRILAHSTGNNVDAVLNYIPRLDRDVLVNGYRSLVTQLYSPKVYYQRVREFLRHYRPLSPNPPLARHEILAFLRSLWLLGVRHKGRRGYWRLLIHTLASKPRAFAEAVNLAICGYHFRRIAAAMPKG
jgi:radical SAM superfamily enzyme YgiQ (UPF0313 family)